MTLVVLLQELTLTSNGSPIAPNPEKARYAYTYPHWAMLHTIAADEHSSAWLSKCDLCTRHFRLPPDLWRRSYTN